jgi:biotin carboxylase
MAHLLIIELPGGNDTDILEATVRMGHSFAFLTQDLSVYSKAPKVYEWVTQATDLIELPSFEYSLVEFAVLRSHRANTFDGVIGLIDIRLIETAKIAARLGLKYLNVNSATLLRDKFNVRQRLQSLGVVQPAFALATTNEEVKMGIDALGIPILIKPSDGYGSQNILALETPGDLELAGSALENLLPIATDYGLGVRGNDRLIIERYMRGTLMGCDVCTLNGKHILLGINEKVMFKPPSFAIRGGCFMPNKGGLEALESYLFGILDAVEFDCGASHIEIMVTEEGPRLVEINPRLVGAKIPRLIGYSLNCSLHEAIINLHLGIWPFDTLKPDDMKPSVTRWLVAHCDGILEGVELPSTGNAYVKCVEILRSPGEHVSYPFENSQRLGYVITSCIERSVAEHLAEKFITDSNVRILE